MNSNQHGTRFNGRRDIFVAKHVIGGTRRRHVPTCTLDRLDMLTESRSRIRDSFLDYLSSRETSLDIREPDAESAIRLFLDDSDIMHRHPVDTPHHTRGIASCTVMPALIAGIHVFLSLFAASKTWMAGTQARLRAS
jgi:hypothetical protein